MGTGRRMFLLIIFRIVYLIDIGVLMSRQTTSSALLGTKIKL